MKVENKTNGTKCYARVSRDGWAIIDKKVITFYTEREFTDNYIILL